jgi:hypothetical protein
MNIEKIYDDINHWFSLSIFDLEYYRNLIINILKRQNKDCIKIQHNIIYLVEPVNNSIDKYKNLCVSGEFYFWYSTSMYKVSTQTISVNDMYEFMLLERRIKLEHLKKLIHDNRRISI